MSKEEKPFRPFITSPERVFGRINRILDDNKAIIFLDTNVLLAPYRSTKEALEVIHDTYSKLKSEGRLVIPGQVAREFAANKPNLLTDLHKMVTDARTVSINGQLKAIPILVGTEEYNQAKKSLDDASSALRAYREAVEMLIDRVASWQGSDPVMEVYEGLFDEGVVKEVQLDENAIENLRKARYQARVPPGYRDKTKEDGGIGDLIIWQTILEVCALEKKDAILVTEDKKDDWFHHSNGHKLFPRYELIEEFSERTSGKSFGIKTLSSLLQSRGADEAVVQEVKDQEQSSEVRLLVPGNFETYAEDLVRQRILTTNVLAVRSNSFPDFVLEYDTSRIGLAIVPLEGGEQSLVSSAIRRAQQAYKTGAYKEIAIVIVTAHMNVAVWLSHRFAEENYLGPGVVAIVCGIKENGLIVTINQSRDAPLTEIFSLSSNSRLN